jgi:hypothetical protein
VPACRFKALFACRNRLAVMRCARCQRYAARQLPLERVRCAVFPFFVLRRSMLQAVEGGLQYCSNCLHGSAVADTIVSTGIEFWRDLMAQRWG